MAYNKNMGCAAFALGDRIESPGLDPLQSFADEIAFLARRYDASLYTRSKLGINGIMIGASSALRHLNEIIEKVAHADLPVLIEAEFGSGELAVAAAIHCRSSRSHRPFVVLSCSAHAFSDFRAELSTALSQAQGGSLFIKSIDELDHAMQRELLAVFTSLNCFDGSGRMDVRILTSVSHSLDQLVRAGHFCRSLRTEIEVLKVETPPLRSRREDIPLLLEHELRKNQSYSYKKFSEEALAACEAYDWPENLLELERTVARLAVMTDGDCINLADLQQHLGWSLIDKPEASLLEESRPEDEESELLGTSTEVILSTNGEFGESLCVPDTRIVNLACSLVAGDFHGLERYGVGIERALTYIAKNFDREISLTELAKQSCFSPSHLSFLFKKTLGVSFKAILAVVRIEKAKQLLVEKPNHSITEISLDVGFGDLSHFEKTFKRLAGLNPREFRRRKNSGKSDITAGFQR